MSDVQIMKYEDITDLMTADDASQVQYDPAKAGLGSEDVRTSDVILPRAVLLQPLSKPVVNGLPGAKPGRMWLSPFNRPLCDPDGEDGLPKGMSFVVARIYPVQRWWESLEKGGGILCESVDGSMTAKEANGLAGARLAVLRDKKTKEVSGIEWEDGEPTADCSECCYGPGAAACAAGRAPNRNKPNAWLPKSVVIEGEFIRIPDGYRTPVCDGGQDALVMLIIPAFGGMPPQLMPAFVTFSRTSGPAGKQMAGMIKMNASMPSWSQLFRISSRGKTNDKGSFFVMEVAACGAAKRPLQDKAEELYERSKSENLRADMSDDENQFVRDDNASRSSAPADISEDEMAPDESF